MKRDYRRRETKRLALGILALAIGLITVSYFLGVFGKESPRIPGGLTAAATATPPLPLSPRPPSATSAGNSVRFKLEVLGVDGAGLSWNVSARLTNTANSDAHQVWTKTEVFSENVRVKLDGEDYVRVDIGTLEAGAVVTRQVKLTVAAFDALKIARNGAKLVLTVYSDEHTQTFSYDYKP